MIDTSLRFLNYSNHPTEQWSAIQIAAVRELCPLTIVIHDRPFPYIDPTFDHSDIQGIAIGEAEIISNVGYDIVHIMGEQTYCYQMINILKGYGMRCVASTTERIVEEIDGKKISTFKFVRFRDY